MSLDVEYRSYVQGDVEHGAMTAGLVTRDTLHRIRRRRYQALKDYGADSPLAALADLRRAVWAVSLTDMDELYLSTVPANAMAVVGALVVSPANVDLFKRHTWSLAQEGIMRKVFTCPLPAHAWLQERLALLEPQCHWSRKSRPSPPSLRDPVHR